MAFSYVLIHWTKHENNPLKIEKPDHLDLGDCWGEPLVWNENDTFFMILRANDASLNVPVALLYHSKDVFNWEFKHVFTKDANSNLGFIMEYPDFFKLEKEHLLISCDDIPPFKNTFYRTGTYNDHYFETKAGGFIVLGN
jgi:sucrose-6-phosphate hydrolase SacC (GH32 family)